MRRPMILGHRGASGYAPENTLPSFELCLAQGADGIELDVQETSDGVLVICHDETLDRTSNGTGWLKDHTFAKLRELDFSCGSGGYDKTPMPTLSEVLELTAPTGALVNIELKNGVVLYPNLEEKVLALVRRFGMEDRIIYSSFNHHSMVRMRELAPKADIGLLYMDGPIGIGPYAARHKASAIHPALYDLQFQGEVEGAKRLGLAVRTWTVNKESQLRLCVQAGVDAIYTNYPDRALLWLKRLGL